MKNKIPGLIATHCLIHRQPLVTHNLSVELHNSLRIAIKCINKIKAHSLNYRLFRALCHDSEEVQWLSNSAYMTRFYSLYDSAIEFLCGLAIAIKTKNSVFHLQTG